MKKTITSVLLLVMLIAAVPVFAQGEQHMYLVPIITDPSAGRGPKYFCFIDGDPNPCVPNYSMIDYGFEDTAVVLARDISPEDHAFLLLQPDVYFFPDNLDTPIVPNTVDTFFEGVGIPVNWTGPSTTNRELLHSTLAMFQINQKYGTLSGGQSILGSYTLEDRPRDMTAQELQWLRDALNFFEAGLGEAINVNQTFRVNLNNARSVFDTWTFVIGSLEF